MKQALITGAHGFIGRNLAFYLHSLGYKVIGLGHGDWSVSESAAYGIAHWLSGEISFDNLSQIKGRFGSPDLIFHLAGGSSVGASFLRPYEDYIRTVSSTSTLLEWVRGHAIATPVIAISSAAVYGANYSDQISEQDLTCPSSPYGAHKLMMEELCRSYARNFGLSIVLPRIFSVYGAGLKKQLLWDLCGKVSKGGDVVLGGTGEELRDWMHISDVSRALEKVSTLASTGAPVVNIGTGIPLSVSEVARLLMSFWYEKKSSLPNIVFNQNIRLGDPHFLVANNEMMRASHIAHNLGISDGISQYVAWYKNLFGAIH